MSHDFVGRLDRDCDVCGEPDRADVHVAHAVKGLVHDRDEARIEVARLRGVLVRIEANCVLLAASLNAKRDTSLNGDIGHVGGIAEDISRALAGTACAILDPYLPEWSQPSPDRSK